MVISAERPSLRHTGRYVGRLAAQLMPGGGIDFGAISHIIMILIILYVFSAACTYTQGFIMTGIAMKVTYQFRKNIAEKCSPASPMTWTPSATRWPNR